jgi:hypothetical protein
MCSDYIEAVRMMRRRHIRGKGKLKKGDEEETVYTVDFGSKKKQ